jgi:hypothetical protein
MSDRYTREFDRLASIIVNRDDAEPTEVAEAMISAAMAIYCEAGESEKCGYLLTAKLGELKNVRKARH